MTQFRSVFAVTRLARLSISSSPVFTRDQLSTVIGFLDCKITQPNLCHAICFHRIGSVRNRKSKQLERRPDWKCVSCRLSWRARRDLNPQPPDP